MSLKIYGIAASRAIRPLWAAEELGLPYEQIPIHYASPEVKQPGYLRLNPNGTVPVIEDNGLVVFESLAITTYLARRYGAGTLGPDGWAEEAAVLQWTLWAATEAEPLARQWFHHTRFLPEDRREPGLARAALQALAPRLAVLANAVSATGYLVAGRFTVADLNMAAVLQRLAELGGHDHAGLMDWHRRCLERPAARRAFALRQPG
ncbi:glutathione S-transferase family protein [Ideonella sp. B7]|uniref:glutathione S-transferase family protein n=1 Tax=Ideonella benzenivorans TaxID=2831643 RepID=UPI001CED02A4|nr:glutathione S-transferase family protein [Ideonella benzenivorans]MCA6217125.1 glutathione S-transferase family protein [Ideonella benzenivorans]